MQTALTTISKIEELEPRELSIVVRERGIDTPAKSIGCGVISVKRSVKEHGYRETAALIVSQIVRLQTMLNPARQMQAEAIAETAKMVVDFCVNDDVVLNFADIEIVFRRAAGGRYGQFFGGFGSADVLSWFSSYLQEKAEAYVQYNIEKSKEYNYYSPRSNGKASELKKHHDAAVAYINNKNKQK